MLLSQAPPLAATEYINFNLFGPTNITVRSLLLRRLEPHRDPVSLKSKVRQLPSLGQPARTTMTISIRSLFQSFLVFGALPLGTEKLVTAPQAKSVN
jgi:hypothetical protein